MSEHDSERRVGDRRQGREQCDPGPGDGPLFQYPGGGAWHSERRRPERRQSQPAPSASAGGRWTFLASDPVEAEMQRLRAKHGDPLGWAVGKDKPPASVEEITEQADKLYFTEVPGLPTPDPSHQFHARFEGAVTVAITEARKHWETETFGIRGMLGQHAKEEAAAKLEAENARLREALEASTDALRAMRAWFYCERMHLGAFNVRVELCNLADYLSGWASTQIKGCPHEAEFQGVSRMIIAPGEPRIERAEYDQVWKLVEEAEAHQRAALKGD